MLRSLPNVGVVAALCVVMEDMEEELSARARGAKGGGLPDTGGLNGRVWRQHTCCESAVWDNRIHSPMSNEHRNKMSKAERETRRHLARTRSVIGFPGGSFGREDGRGGGGGGTGLP